MNIVLASASPRRATLLHQIGITFKTDPSDAVESFSGSLTPSQIVISLSERKGIDVASRHANSLVIASDTIVSLNNKILGKPADEAEARKMLFLLSDKTHQVYSGVFVAKTDQNKDIVRSFSFYERTNVTFSALTELEVNHYIASGSPFDKAGSYGIQDDLGSLFVKRIDGDYFNVVGFPLHSFYQKLKTEMPEVFHQIFY